MSRYQIIKAHNGEVCFRGISISSWNDLQPQIKDKEDYWEDFVSDTTKFESVKSYVYMKVRLMFDPPSSSAVMESMNRMISELEWRLNVAAESK